ncbi:MAG: hypothetical protein J1G04_02135 [Clostridiales bacterium]|nr:hypothetical protein [Clostridiales bacterium]
MNKKRVLTGILSTVVAGTTLTGCAFFEHDTERDYQQVAAHIESYVVETPVKVDDGLDEAGFPLSHIETKKYTTEAIDIYKYDIVQYVNNNISSLQQSYGSDYRSLFRYAVEMLVDIELVENAVDALIDAGEIKWNYHVDEDGNTVPDYTETNAINRQIYSVIDSSLVNLKNEILDERDKPQITTSGDSNVSTDTTYPTKPEEENDEDVREYEKWEPSISRYPGLSGDAENRSLDREAVRRLINLLKNRVADDFRVTAEDKRLFEEDENNINKIINEKGIEYVYPALGQTHWIYYITGKSVERSQKISSLQAYLNDTGSVETSEVVKTYTSTLNEQRSAYTADVSEFESAVTGGSTVLFYPNNNYFYVKHILLPFSDEQKGWLTNYKSKHTEDEVEEYRKRLVDNIVCYPHLYGEDDKTRPMTVSDVMEIVRSKMLPLSSNVAAADAAFDDLIYLYNTDPGAFNNNKGYVVKYKLNDGENETYMQEFADGARYMYDNLNVGEVYYEPVITDYGVHIMYFASTTKVGEVALSDYTTPGRLETYYDIFEKQIKSQRESEAYTKWENEVLTYNFNKHVTLYEKRYKDLWEDRS